MTTFHLSGSNVEVNYDQERKLLHVTGLPSSPDMPTVVQAHDTATGTEEVYILWGKVETSPAPIKVGDRVRCYDQVEAVVLAIQCVQCDMHIPHDSCWLVGKVSDDRWVSLDHMERLDVAT